MLSFFLRGAANFTHGHGEASQKSAFPDIIEKRSAWHDGAILLAEVAGRNSFFPRFIVDRVDLQLQLAHFLF